MLRFLIISALLVAMVPAVAAEPPRDPAADAAAAFKRGDVNDAERMLRAVVAKAEARGPDSPELAGALENLAAFHDGLDEADKAEPLYLRAVAVFERALGDRHPRLVTSLNFVGSFYEEAERYDDAARIFTRAMKATEGWVGPSHPVFAGALAKLAGIFRKAKKYGEAEPLYLRAIAIRETASDPKRLARTLEGYAALLRATGRAGDAAAIDARVKALR